MLIGTVKTPHRRRQYHKLMMNKCGENTAQAQEKKKKNFLPY